MKSFAEKMKEARKSRGMNQTEFGALLGVSGRMIIEYEKGTRRPHRRKVQEFAAVLEVPEEYLLEDRFDDVLSVFNQDAQTPADSPAPDSGTEQTAGRQSAAEIEAQARREIEFLKERSAALFAGGALPQEAKDAFFRSLYEAYLKCREQAVEKDVNVDRFGY
ncbi:MAG: helix-turn-helix transcriptional regulator [Oscillospiraceae bacterium]|nr:helix-turn-helix transcriptional regulator [Oscillospiraceae bacterium]